MGEHVRTPPDGAALTRLASLAETVPGVTGAVAVARQRVRSARVPEQHPLRRGAAPEAEETGLEPVRPVSLLHSRPRAIAIAPSAELAPDSPATLREALHRAASVAARKGTIYLAPDGTEQLQSYAELLAQAQRMLGGLQAAGLRPGDSALFQFRDNRDYVTAFWACVLGGIVPTPVALAPDYDRHSAISRKLCNAWKLLGCPAILTEHAAVPDVSRLGKLWDEPHVTVLDIDDLAASGHSAEEHDATPADPVLHLLTSGSTGVPKCVRHTNGSVAARTYGVAQACGYGADDITLNWMPLDHVAIVMYNVRDVFLGSQHVNAQVNMFLTDPLSWMTWIDRYRATNTLGPNFAYALVNERADDITTASWDLSCMRAMDNAAEPIINRTAHRFLELLAPHGLPARAMRPCWGMSETCSGVTYTWLDRDNPGTGAIAVDAASLTGDIRESSAAGKDAILFTDVGRPVPGLSARIADSRDEVVPEYHVGELQVSGDVIMAEYFGNTTANQACRTADGWFRTGDLAFMHDGTIVITGRVKDQIIVRGVNYLAHEIEAAVEEVPGVQVSHVAAAAVTDETLGPERLALFFVPGDDDPGTVSQVISDVRQQLVRDIGISPDFVVPLSRDEFPKTSSGKVQRGQLAAELHAGTFSNRLNRLGDSYADYQTARAPWFFERVWRPAKTAAAGIPYGGSWVVFDGDGWWDEVCATLPAVPDQVVVVRPGDAATAGPGAFSAAARARYMSKVLHSVHAQFGPVGTVLFGWGLGGATEAILGDQSGSKAAHAMADGVCALFSLLQALAPGDCGKPMLLALTTGGTYVRPGDRVNLAAAPVSGLVRTAIDEAVLPVIRQVDLPGDRKDWPAAIQAELLDRGTSGVIARRDGGRWAARLRPASDEDGPDRAQPGIISRGLYLMTGGLGGIGYEIAQYLLAVYQVRLLLVGRTPVDSRASTDERAARLADLAEYGEVRYSALDVANPVALQAAVEAAEQQWQRPLDGVLHLAGADISEYWDRMEEHRLASETAESFQAMYKGKVFGTLAVGAMLESRPHAAVILFSSVNGDLGGSFFGAYSSANSFLTGFADYWHHQRGRPVRCLAWSMWADTGMNAGKLAAAAQYRGFRPITTSQGIACFLAALSASSHHLLIGLDPENPRMLAEFAAEDLAETEIILAYTSERPVSPDDVAAVVHAAGLFHPAPLRICHFLALPRDASGNIDTNQVLIDGAVRHEVPENFAEPATPCERQLARIWADVLNRPRVGRDDSFFELGGNSLRAVQLVARISSKLDIAIAMKHLYANPTVKELAEVMDGLRASG
jgi:acyl-CoA synthetase (AMP-forming)/AMP-acid ligase II/NAD(P)-dependent dehydrogenase (short-subunit alcohol dehydrogenase family)/acyl carrier protein